ncbi:hypothetical protein [Tissierella praeacuta]|uniref:hypothetical protein n=1 Tax=Tissierella praeacuta TaxID=43131 RepID=UPI00333E7CB0
MLEFILGGIIILPILVILIYSIINPEAMATWGYRWRYKGELEPTEEYINYIRVSSVISLLLIISMVIISFNPLYGTIFLILSIFIALYYFLIK